jgi:hypothetical protein
MYSEAIGSRSGRRRSASASGRAGGPCLRWPASTLLGSPSWPHRYLHSRAISVTIAPGSVKIGQSVKISQSAPAAFASEFAPGDPCRAGGGRSWASSSSPLQDICEARAAAVHVSYSSTASKRSSAAQKNKISTRRPAPMGAQWSPPRMTSRVPRKPAAHSPAAAPQST